MKERNEELVNYLDTLINNDVYVARAQEYIKENYGVLSEYDTETSTIYLYTINVNESLNVVAAKEYILEQFTPELINIVYGKKEIN